ncbi:TonB-dependent receptor [Sphingomonas sp. QA11]|uniref:TonB-dependent receptor domain-containing protein n=1 Tax=Sphingomonas sp. QA11 TaxID=2950605 RepID=UPI0023492F63|nr:TonB-dependent receptor [Sphingomonas sp. QA11]WCM28932.1 TonB-dependent receptor [Sphingomonas sp. QA11]
MSKILKNLARGGSSIALGTALCIVATPAWAQSASGAEATQVTAETSLPTADDQSVAEPQQDIVVTGTSIRGVAPIGSNLVAVGAEALHDTGAQTVTGALASVPSLSGITGQGNTSAFYQPSIHQLGASASNSTLVLIDGHRGPTGGTNHTFLDPNIVPNIMLERVEVLAEGASSIYGSDAVAGVINFITRKRYDGIQAEGSVTLRNGTTGYSAGLLAGQTWDRGWAVIGAQYSYQDNLRNRDRAFTNPNHIAQGGTNFLTRSCSPAGVQPGGSGGIYYGPYTNASLPNNTANYQCTNWGVTDLIGSEERQSIMGKISFDVTDKLTIGLDLLYARRRNDTLQSAGTLQTTVFRTGARANPFYVNPTAVSPFLADGVTPNPAYDSQTVTWDATDLVGPAHGRSDSDSMYANFTATYELTSDWHVDFLASAGRDESTTYTTGVINSSVANLALNGTTNSAGNLTQPSIPGTSTIVTQLPLTAANALDVWNPAGATNRTGAATIARLLDNTNRLRATSGYQQFRASASGSLFDLPAGPVKVAFGVELLKTQLSQLVTRANNSGPASTGSQQLFFPFDRTVWSGFVELNVPIVSPDMDTFIRRVDISLAGRYDHYDDFGSTTNPKIGFNLEPIQGLRLRGNWSTSFVAPPLTIIGDRFGAFGTAGWNTQTNNISVPVAAYPDVLKIPSLATICSASQPLCNIGTLQGIQNTTGDPNAKAQEGSGWSLGFDVEPSLIPGLRAGFTYWNTKFTGGVTGPQLANVINTASAQYLLTFYPNCATAAEIAAVTQGIPQTNATAACTNYIFHTLNTNWLNLDISGIDYQIDYDYRTDNAGTFSAGLSGTEFTKFDQSFGSGPKYSVLNTAGNNGTFPSLKRKARAYLGWANGPFSARLFANYTGGFRNWSSNTVTPLTRDANGNPNGGGDKVKAQTSFDLNMAYEFKGSFLNGTRISLSGLNIFDQDPPFYNTGAGYYSLIHNPFGRTVTLALNVKF